MIRPIATIHTDYDSKFGIPRQPGLVPDALGRIVFTPEFRSPDTVRGLEAFSHLWLIWSFSENLREDWSATVRPPRLGGNTRLGVFATRSPYRPNPLGLSVVKLVSVEPDTPEGPVITVSGVDMMNGTPIYDIKPYLPHTDCHPEAIGGFSGEVKDYAVAVEFPEALLSILPGDKRAAILEVLRQDPRPGYRHGDSERRYGVEFAGYDVRFTVKDGILRVCEVVPLNERGERP